jgi:uncharacterized protein (DUF58 family)
MRPAPILGFQRSPSKDVLLRGEATDARWYLASFALLILGLPLHLPLLVISGILLILVLAITDLWARYCLHDLRYQRTFTEQQATFGEVVTLSLSVENAKLLPLPWLEIEDTIPRALPIVGQELLSNISKESGTLECLFSPGWYERITRRYDVHCTTRGIHTFGPTILRSGDAFGFLNREMQLENRQFVLVYPLVLPLESFRLPSRHPFGERRAPRRLLEDPSRIVGVRDYAYGDSLRRVNWKATARTLQLQSKIYETTTTHSLVIFLNAVARADTHYGVYPELQELAICAAASVSEWAIDQGYAVGLYSNASLYLPDEKASSSTLDWEARLADQLRRRRIRLPAASSQEQRKRIMETLARIQTYFGGSIEEILQAERTHLPSGATVVMITSTLSEQLIDTLAHMQQRGYAVTILFIGNTPPPMRLGGIALFHLGGEERWQTLQASYLKEGESTSGFQL